MADWLGGYSSEWCVYEVDPETWADLEPIDSVISVSISRDGTDDVPLLESGTMTTDSENPIECAWCRICMRLDQDGMERVPIATLLFEQSKIRTEFRSPTSELRGRSVLQPAADAKIEDSGFAPAGCNGAEFAARLLRECTPAPIVAEGSFTLSEDVVFDIGSSYLSAAWKVLKAADWCIQIDGNGVATIREKPSEPGLELDRAHAGLLIPGVDRTFDISDVPNRYVAVSDGKKAVAVNDNPELPASYPRRGRWVTEVDTSPVPINGESLEHYALRRLNERSIVLKEYSYEREYWPGIVPFSLVRATLQADGLTGDLRVLSQTLECGNGVKVSERAGQEVMV